MMAVVVALATVAATTSVAVFVWPGVGGDNTLHGPAGSDFTITYPDGWSALSQEELAPMPSQPLAALRTQGGMLTVQRGGRAGTDFTKYGRDLPAKLRKKFGSIEVVSAKTVRINAGRAFLFTFVRKGDGTVNSIVLVPAGEGSYLINTLSPGGANEAASQIGKMVRSFDVK